MTKKFNLTQWTGKVKTYDGQEAQILDRNYPGERPILASFKDRGGKLCSGRFRADGTWKKQDQPFLVPDVPVPQKPKYIQKYMNVSKKNGKEVGNTLYATEQEAQKHIKAGMKTAIVMLRA